MCYSAEASKIAFITNVISNIILVYYSYIVNKPILRLIALFFGYIGIIQLYDWILWENQDNNINYITSKIQLVHLNLEPVMLAYFIYKFKGNLTYNSLAITILYSIVSFIYTMLIIDKFDYTKVEDGVLVWNNSMPKYRMWFFVYILFVMSFVVLAFDNFEYPMNIIFSGSLIATLIFGLYYREQAGRWWCKISSIIPILFLFI